MGIFSLVVTIVLAVDIVRGLIGDTSCNLHIIILFSHYIKSKFHTVNSWWTNYYRFIKICHYINYWFICYTDIYLWIMFLEIFICLLNFI